MCHRRTSLYISRKDVRESLNDRVYLLVGRPAAEAEPNRPYADLRRHAHRLQHGRQLNTARMAGGAGGGGDAIKRGEDFRADVPDKGNVERVRQAPLGIAVEQDAGAVVLTQRLPKAVRSTLTSCISDKLLARTLASPNAAVNRALSVPARRPPS